MVPLLVLFLATDLDTHCCLCLFICMLCIHSIFLLFAANGIIDTDQQVYSGYANTLVGEQYDPNYGVARTSNTAPWDEAHFYRECSNKVRIELLSTSTR